MKISVYGCRHIYNLAEEDSTQYIAPGSSFEDVPDRWVCPIFGAEKSRFREVVI